MKKIILSFLTLLMIIVLASGVVYGTSNHNDDHKVTICHCEKTHCETLNIDENAAKSHLRNHPNDSDGACHIVYPSKTPTPTLRITWAPSITPTTTVTLTPTPTIEITPIATPSATLTPVDKKEDPKSDDTPLKNDTTTLKSPTCDTVKPGDVANLSVDSETVNDGKIKLYWALPLRAQTVNIRYSEVDGDWRYSVIDYPNTGNIEIAGLKNGQNYWFQVQGKDGCAYGNWSHSIDPTP